MSHSFNHILYLIYYTNTVDPLYPYHIKEFFLPRSCLLDKVLTLLFLSDFHLPAYLLILALECVRYLGLILSYKLS